MAHRGRRRSSVRHRRRDRAAAAHPVPVPALRGGLPGPGQRRFRGARDEPRPRFQRRRLRPWLGHLLRVLHLARGAQQSDAGPPRRPPLDRPHHVHLGPRVGGHGLRSRCAHLLRPAFPARRGRSRVLPRHHLLPDAVVPGAGTGQGRGPLHDRDGHRRRDWRTDLERLAVARRRGRTPGLAVAVRGRGPPGHSPGAGGVAPTRRSARDGHVAVGGRARVAGRHPGRRGPARGRRASRPARGAGQRPALDAGGHLLLHRAGVLRRQLLAAADPPAVERLPVGRGCAHLGGALRRGGHRHGGRGRALRPHGRAALARGRAGPRRRARLCRRGQRPAFGGPVAHRAVGGGARHLGRARTLLGAADGVPAGPGGGRRRRARERRGQHRRLRRADARRAMPATRRAASRPDCGCWPEGWCSGPC